MNHRFWTRLRRCEQRRCEQRQRPQGAHDAGLASLLDDTRPRATFIAADAGWLHACGGLGSVLADYLAATPDAPALA